jgi:hypothetical protein
MVEADSPFKLLPTSILDIYKLLEHIDRLFISMHYQPLTFIPTLHTRFWGSESESLLGLKWSHYVMIEADNHLKLLPISILDIYKLFEHIDMLPISIHYQPHNYQHHTVVPTLHTTWWLQFWGSESHVGSKWSHYVMIEAANHLKLLPIFISDIAKQLSTLICCR